jgi:Ribonuclease B OB domain
MALYPERAQILEALAHASPLSLDDLMRVFAVAPAKRKGFERLLDNLVFEGGIEGGEDGSFSAVVAKAKQEAPASRRSKSLPPPSKAGKADDGPKSRNDPYRKQPGKQAIKKGLPEVLAKESKRAPESTGKAGKQASTMPGYTTERAERGAPKRAAASSDKEGTLSVNARGFGFVAIAGQDDVFIGGEGLGNAMHGEKCASPSPAAVSVVTKAWLPRS